LLFHVQATPILERRTPTQPQAMLATRSRMNARHRCVRTALIKVHGENNYGAHRLPAGKTAAKEYGAGVLLVRRRN